MSRMIQQILDFTRSRLGGGPELTFAPMDLRDALVPIVNEMRLVHPAATIQLQCPELRSALWDRNCLEQVFSNLIGNALAHGNPDKPVTVMAGADPFRVTGARCTTKAPPFRETFSQRFSIRFASARARVALRRGSAWVSISPKK